MIEAQNITKMLRDWSDGDRDALENLMPLVHDELHRQAVRFLNRERRNHTLQSAALINETYLKLIDQRDVVWKNRSHFFGIAASLMRRILVDYARRKHRDKRGGNLVLLSLDDSALAASGERTIDLMALDEALGRLENIDGQQARVVELRYFSGLTLEETAEIMNVSRATVANEWRMAKAWLYRELTR